MTEFSNEQQPPPIEAQRPPVITDEQADAILHAKKLIEDSRTGSDGNAQYHEKVMGVTANGWFISVEILNGDFANPDYHVIRSATLIGLAAGGEMGVEKIAYEDPDNLFGPKAMMFRDGGTTIYRSDSGRIYVPSPSRKENGETATIDGFVIFPIGEDGKPLVQADIVAS